MINRSRLIAALTNVGGVPAASKKFPFQRRTIYETATGEFSVDYATFPGGTTEDVPLALITELEAEGIIVPAYPDYPKAKAWILAPAPERKP